MLYGALNDLDHYQLLGVEPTADEARIQSAWLDLSVELHPDRFFLLRSGELKEKIYAIYRRLAEAQRVLTDPDLRRDYDQTCRAKEVRRVGEPRRDPPQDPESLGLQVAQPSVQAFAERAEAAYARGAFQDARFYLHAILACEIDNPTAERALRRVEAELGPTL